MLSPPQSIINDERQHNLTRSRFAVRNVFCPKRAPCSVTTESITRAAPIASAMAHSTPRLIGAMVGRSPTHPRRNRQRPLRLGIAKKTNCFVERSDALFCAQHCPARQHQQITAKMGAQLLDERGVVGGIRARQIHFIDHGIRQNSRRVRRIAPSARNLSSQHPKTESNRSEPHYGFYKQLRCQHARDGVSRIGDFQIASALRNHRSLWAIS